MTSYPSLSIKIPPIAFTRTRVLICIRNTKPEVAIGENTQAVVHVGVKWDRQLHFSISTVLSSIGKVATILPMNCKYTLLTGNFTITLIAANCINASADVATCINTVIFIDTFVNVNT